MSPLDLYVLVFSPVVVLGLIVVPLLIVKRDVRRAKNPVEISGRLQAAWSAHVAGDAGSMPNSP